MIVWNYAMIYLFLVYLMFDQQMLNWLFGHFGTLTVLLGKKIHQ